MKKLLGRKVTQALISILFLSLSAGCSTICIHKKWPRPILTTANESIAWQSNVPPQSDALSSAEVAYSSALEAMDCCDAKCVDCFFQAAQFAWQDIQKQIRTCGTFGGRASEIYQSSLIGLIIEGQYHKRFDPTCRLQVNTPQGWTSIECVYHGFQQNPKEFNSLISVGDYSTKELNTIFCKDGLGVPVVVARTETFSGPFQRSNGVFAATLVLRSDTVNATSADPFVLEFYNPIETSSLCIHEVDVPIAFDKSAATARVVATTQRNYFQSFIQPGSARTTDEYGLFMLEPYQPGKIPIIFVHGLLSDRLTWANMVNELRACPFVANRYQLWGFQYSTGGEFLVSAALLRRQLRQLRCIVDPNATDTALENTVLVGHSMGGLISKVQIADSKNKLWDSISKCPFDQVVMDDFTREQFTQTMFFERSRMVSRVVFIGTPHRGSVIAQRAVGRLGSMLVDQPIDLELGHRKLLCDNPDVFSREYSNRIPTSIDILEPKSPLLFAVNSLPLDPKIQMHSIIGRGRWMLGSGDSDGVVPVTSARQEGAISEMLVHEKHTDLTKNALVIAELLSILREHCKQADVKFEHAVIDEAIEPETLLVP